MWSVRTLVAPQAPSPSLNQVPKTVRPATVSFGAGKQKFALTVSCLTLGTYKSGGGGEDDCDSATREEHICSAMNEYGFGEGCGWGARTR